MSLEYFAQTDNTTQYVGHTSSPFNWSAEDSDPIMK